GLPDDADGLPRRRPSDQREGGAAALRPRLDAILEALRLRKRLELLERVVLDLPDALPRHAEGAADLLERARLLALQPEPQLDHLPLALRQRLERLLDVVAAQGQRRLLVRRLRGLVLDEVAE